MSDKEHWVDTDLAEFGHFTLGTHPVTGKSWAYCLACSSGNGPTLEALRKACRRTCQAIFYDQWGHSMTVNELHIQHQEQAETRHEETRPKSAPRSALVDEYGHPLEE